ncbi:hypothetical protein B0H19DRAFT_159719 [Mycena capillaripes]|nr:hypothetical protein B0H19DRAFT_159719 [Mycena capillaripes]
MGILHRLFLALPLDRIPTSKNWKTVRVVLSSAQRPPLFCLLFTLPICTSLRSFSPHRSLCALVISFLPSPSFILPANVSLDLSRASFVDSSAESTNRRHLNSTRANTFQVSSPFKLQALKRPNASKPAYSIAIAPIFSMLFILPYAPDSNSYPHQQRALEIIQIAYYPFPSLFAMHKSLRLDNLAYLPISVRRFASPAANGSIDDLKRLITLLDEIHSEHTFAQCLPVFYANLDPGGIPTGVNVTTDEVTRAIMALDALHKLGVESKPAWQDLWTRIWPWIAFLHVHRGCLAQERDARPYLMFFLNLFCRDLDTKTLISQTDGVRSLIMEAWAFMLYTEKVDDRAFSRLSTLFPDMEVNDDKNLAELLEGAGGPIGSASIILKSIKKFVPNPRIPDGNIRDLEDVVQFLASFALCWDEESPRSISSALVSSGVVGALTAAACTIGDSHLRHSSAAGILLQSCNILRELLASHHAMRDSLRAGLLRLIIYGATIEIGRDGSSELGMTLATLRGFTVYYTVVAELEVGLRDVEHIVKAQEFQDSDFFQPWCDFVALANDRIALMKELHAKTSVSLKACDNMGVRSMLDYRQSPLILCCSVG